MLKPTLGGESTQSILAAQDKECFQGFPALRSFFLSTRYDGSETAREPGVLIVRPEASRWVWTLKDATFATQLLCSGPTWDEVQLMAEMLLADPRAPWVPDLWAQKRRKGK